MYSDPFVIILSISVTRHSSKVSLMARSSRSPHAAVALGGGETTWEEGMELVVLRGEGGPDAHVQGVHLDHVLEGGVGVDKDGGWGTIEKAVVVWGEKTTSPAYWFWQSVCCMVPNVCLYNHIDAVEFVKRKLNDSWLWCSTVAVLSSVNHLPAVFSNGGCLHALYLTVIDS